LAPQHHHKLKAFEQQKEEEQQQFGPNQQRQRLIFQVNEGHKSSYTAYKYGVDFKHFLNFIKIHDLDVLLDLGKEAIQVLVIKYTRNLRDNPEKKYSRSTVNNRVSAVLYFLDNNDIELNKRKIRRYYPPDESVKDDRPYTREEIAKILSACDLREKAMILLMVSTGVRIGALHTMKIGDLIEIRSQNLALYKIQVYAGTRGKYVTFSTPECYQAIQKYLEYRKRYGEELLLKHPFFRKHFNKDDPFTINLPKFLTEGAVMKAIDGVLKKSGVKTTEAMRSHAWRKGFKSICEQSGMKSINVELLMDHNIGVSGHYYRPSEADLLEDYMTHAADSLTIDPTQRLQQRVKDLEGHQSQEIEQLKKHVKFLDMWVHRWADAYHNLQDGKTLSWSSETDKITRLKVVNEELDQEVAEELWDNNNNSKES
jgi:integrase